MSCTGGQQPKALVSLMLLRSPKQGHQQDMVLLSLDSGLEAMMSALTLTKVSENPEAA